LDLSNSVNVKGQQLLINKDVVNPEAWQVKTTYIDVNNLIMGPE
jgi:hypothetical protein